MKNYAEEKRIRPDILTAALYWSVVVLMICDIVNIRIYGNKGAGFAAGPFVMYCIFYCGFVCAAQKAVYAMVRIRARRSQYLNAEANMRRSLRFFGLLSILIAIVVGACSFVISEKLFGAGRGFAHFIIIAVSILFMGFQGVLRGYLQGIGYTKPIVISDLIVSVTALIVGTILSQILYSYGLKVNNIFHIDEYSAVYGSTGLLIGLFCGAAASCIQTLISFYVRKNEISEFVKTGAPRYLDNRNDVLYGIRPILLLYIAPALVILIDDIVYTLVSMKSESEIDYITNFGIYSGRILAAAVLFTMLCCIPFIKSWNRVMARIERDELEGARERFKGLVRFSGMLFIPVCVFIFAAPDTLSVVLFGRTTDIADNLLRLGSILIFASVLAVFSSWLLSHMGKSIIIVLNVGIAFAAHIVLLLVFELVVKINLYGLMLSSIISFGVYDIICLWMIRQMLRYRYSLISSWVKTIAASLVAGLGAFLIDMLLKNIIGEILTFIITVIVFTAIYLSVLILIRGVKTHELRSFPFGNVLMRISSRLQNDNYYEE